MGKRIVFQKVTAFFLAFMMFLRIGGETRFSYGKTKSVAFTQTVVKEIAIFQYRNADGKW